MNPEQRDMITLLVFTTIGLIIVFTIIFLLAATIAHGAEYTTVASDGPAGPYCAFPGACRLPDGRLIVVYYNGVESGHVTWKDKRAKCGAIAYTLSSDEGKTWSPPAMLLDTELDDRDPDIAVLRDGRIILSYFRLYAPADRKLKGDGVYIAEIDLAALHGSSSGAQTASGDGAGANNEGSIPRLSHPAAVKSIRKLQHDAGCSAPVRDYGDGHLLLGSYHIDQPYVIRSTDNGKSWQVHDIPNGGKHLDAETDTIELYGGPADKHTAQTEVYQDAGRGNIRLGHPRFFYAVMRGSKCNGHYSTSPDGKNWTTAKDIGFVLHCPALHRVELGEGARNTALDTDSGDASSHPRVNGEQAAAGPAHSAILLAHRIPATAMHYSLDECKTWVGPVVVDTCGGAYPAFVTLKDGSVLIVYYTEGKLSDIRCRRFMLTEKGVTWQ